MVLQKHFNFKRFLNYLKYDFTIYGKSYLYFAISLSILIFVISFYNLAKGLPYPDYNFLNSRYRIAFFIIYVISGVTVVGLSFPFFRNKTKTVHFIQLPVAIFEKFLSEFLIRIVAFNIVFFFLFWSVFKFAYFVYLLFEWKNALILESYGLLEVFYDVSSNLFGVAIFSFLLFVMSFLFANASYFKKYVLFKTLILFLLLGFIYYALMVGLSHVLYDNSKGFNIVFFDRRINYQLNSSHLYFFIFTSISSLLFLTITYFNLKEKEV